MPFDGLTIVRMGPVRQWTTIGSVAFLLRRCSIGPATYQNVSFDLIRSFNFQQSKRLSACYIIDVVASFEQY